MGTENERHLNDLEPLKCENEMIHPMFFFIQLPLIIKSAKGSPPPDSAPRIFTVGPNVSRAVIPHQSMQYVEKNVLPNAPVAGPST